MTLCAGPDGLEAPLLQVELGERPYGYLARFRGELVAETMGVLWDIEPLLLNESRISLDLSGVTSVDQAGLIAALKLVEALHSFGGRLSLGA
jgi:ABC-type transporter Mla MlaB component